MCIKKKREASNLDPPTNPTSPTNPRTPRNHHLSLVVLVLGVLRLRVLDVGERRVDDGALAPGHVDRLRLQDLNRDAVRLGLDGERADARGLRSLFVWWRGMQEG